MKNPCMLSIDQGTTSSRAIIYDATGAAIATAQEEFKQHYPGPGWVEHDPDDIWQTTLHVCRQAIAKAKADGAKIHAIGIANQRETTLVWERKTGEPVHNAIVWQDRRTAPICKHLESSGHGDTIREKTGLLLDPYFSATKISWLLDNVEGARTKAQNGMLAFGTVDSFLISRLTGGKVHATDATNASRTSLYNITTGSWDQELCDIFRVPMSILPDVKNCADDFGKTDPELFGESIPICGVAGDQQAALIGQTCFAPGDVKSTYGTGCFVMLNTGKERVQSNNRLLTTVGYQLNGETTYALEGSIFVAGAAVQWLRDGLGLIKHASETEGLARGLSTNEGVYIVPAFTGLGAPHWEPDVRGTIFGLTRATGPAEFARAAVESVCYQTYDLFRAMSDDGVNLNRARVDGGMVANSWMCQYLADIIDSPVDRPVVMETTALGAAFLAGLQSGLYASTDDIKPIWKLDCQFTPRMSADTRETALHGWRRALNAAIQF